MGKLYYQILLYLPTELKKTAKAKNKVPKTICIFFLIKTKSVLQKIFRFHAHYIVVVISDVILQETINSIFAF